jgi:hypothetical protein
MERSPGTDLNPSGSHWQTHLSRLRIPQGYRLWQDDRHATGVDSHPLLGLEVCCGQDIPIHLQATINFGSESATAPDRSMHLAQMHSCNTCLHRL